MEFKNSTIQYIAYGLLGFFAIIILINGFSIKHNILNTIYGNKNINAFNNGDYQLNVREGFTGKKDKSDKSIKDDSVDACIIRKIDATRDELGGEEGCKDIKKILKEVKESCNLEAAKCMMNLLSSNKSAKTINLQNIFNSEDEESKNYQNYTELSRSLNDIIDNL